MKSARVRPQSITVSQITSALYYILYAVVSFFVVIGEIARRIILLPYAVLKYLFLTFLKKTDRVKINIQRPALDLSFLHRVPVEKKRGRGRPRKHIPLRTRLTHYFYSLYRPVRTASKKIVFFTASLLKKIFRFIVTILRYLGMPFVYIAKMRPSKLKRLNPFHRRRGRPRAAPTITSKLIYIVAGAVVTLFILFIYQSYLFTQNLPSPYSIGKVNYPLSTHIYDRKGKLLYEVYRDQNRTPVTLSQLPAYIAQSTIAIEDKDFYNHRGVSLLSGILRAAKENFFSNDRLQGGSTITQQLVKSALLSPERTWERKTKEIILALWTEQIYPKDKILEMYLNQVAYGGSSYGIEEASKVYFGKSAKDLQLGEAALLAGLPQAPSLYSPYVNPDLAVKRRNEVLEVMYQQGYIDKNKKEAAQKAKLAVIPLRTKINAPHFVFYTKSELEKQYGIRAVEEGGFRVTTTLDLNIQREVEKILQEELVKVANLNVTNGAVLVIKPQTGEILSMVGSRDYFSEPDGAFNVTTALRQPGSSIKPIMYAFSLERGFTAATPIDDSPTTFGVPGGEAYRPVNYDGKFHGRVPLRYALANSYNIPAVKVLQSVGVMEFVDYAKRMGITTWNDSSRFGLSLTLGGGEVTMIDMATAFGVFANRGYRVETTNILKLEDSKGEEVYALDPYKTKVIDDGIAYIMSDILSDNQARVQAFGPGSQLEINGYRAAVKTGTTDQKKDNWTIGYTPEFLVAVWVGNNDGTPMNPYLASGITGAAPIWHRVMEYLLKEYGTKEVWFDKPSNIVEKSCYGSRPEYFLAGTENLVQCKDYNLKPTPKQEALVPITQGLVGNPVRNANIESANAQNQQIGAPGSENSKKAKDRQGGARIKNR